MCGVLMIVMQGFVDKVGVKEFGYISLYRSLIKSDMWLSEKFTRGQAWVDLLALANYEDGFIRVRGNKVVVKRGQCGWSQVRLASRWQWSRDKVKRFLNELEDDEQIKQQKSNISTLITITNYNEYQIYKSAKHTTNDTAEHTANGQQTLQQTGSRQGTKNKNNKNNKNNNTCSEQNSSQVISSFILNDGTEYLITQTIKDQYQNTYPIIDLEKEFREIRQWCKDNPAKRKTKRGAPKFVNAWLQRSNQKNISKQQNDAPSAGSEMF